MPRPSFRDFSAAFELDRYRAVPEDWFVAVSDVVGSTQAITSGRYKDVNMAGAATIACVLNACGRDDLPFAFGGDGGTVLVPPEFESACRAALSGAQAMCAEVMGLTLRCSLIPLSEVKKRGRDVLVAWHDLGSGRLLAMLAGGGVETAERLCKSADGACFAVQDAAGEPDLGGLSCRWEPLTPERGVILSLVVRARDEASALPAIYRDIYGRIAEVAGPGASPVRAGAFSVAWPPRGTRLEAAIQGHRGRFKRLARILLEAACSVLSLKIGKPVGGFDARAYVESLPRHSDTRKYADSLRMVIDCTAEQAETIRSFLDAEWRRGVLDYGTHAARAALMTCFVRSVDEAGHIHFIDGADGGYALAALDMKRRMAR